MLTRNIYRFRKRLEQRLHHMVWLVPVQKLQMQIAPGLIGEPLEKFSGQPKPECGRHILRFFGSIDPFMRQAIHSAPNKIRPPAEIHHATRQAFIHRYIRLARERIPGIKPSAVTSNTFFIA